jgi:cytochrome P450
MIIKEGMRLFPPAPGVSRETSKDCELNGYKIPKGTTIFIPFFAIHHV